MLAAYNAVIKMYQSHIKILCRIFMRQFWVNKEKQKNVYNILFCFPFSCLVLAKWEAWMLGEKLGNFTEYLLFQTRVNISLLEACKSVKEVLLAPSYRWRYGDSKSLNNLFKVKKDPLSCKAKICTAKFCSQNF